MQAYKYKSSDLTKIGLNPRLLRPFSRFYTPVTLIQSATPSSFVRNYSHRLNLSGSSASTQPPQPMFSYDPHISLANKHSLVRAYFDIEPVLHLHLQEPFDQYNISSPDWSCAIQLALLYRPLYQEDWTVKCLCRNPAQPYLRYKRAAPVPLRSVPPCRRAYGPSRQSGAPPDTHVGTQH